MVVPHRERYDFPEVQFLEAEAQQFAAGFGDVAVAPELRRQPPADLDHTQGACRHDGVGMEAGEADAGRAFLQLERGEAVAARRVIVAYAVEEGVGLGAGAAEGEEAHHARVGIDAVEEVAVAILPVADDEPCRLQPLHPANSSRR